jgi:hypothetical protein
MRLVEDAPIQVREDSPGVLTGSLLATVSLAALAGLAAMLAFNLIIGVFGLTWAVAGLAAFNVGAIVIMARSDRLQPSDDDLP